MKRVVTVTPESEVVGIKDVPDNRIVALRTVNDVYILRRNDDGLWEFTSIYPSGTFGSGYTKQEAYDDAMESNHPTKDVFLFEDLHEFAVWLVEVTK